MDLLMNGLLMAASLFAGGYCWVLGRRVNQLKSLDKGLGGAIVNLTRQTELARVTLEEARTASTENRNELGELISRAESAAGNLRLLIAAVPAPQVGRTSRTAARETAGARFLEPHPKAANSEQRSEITLSASVPVPEQDPDAPDDGGWRLAEAKKAASAVPKPRIPHPVENPLRRQAKGAPAQAPARSEEDILEALTALAAEGS